MKTREEIISLAQRALGVLFFAGLILLFLRARIFKIHLPFLTISMTSARNIVTLMGLLWAALFVFKGFRVTRKTAIDKGLAVFLLWFIISCLFAQYPGLSAGSVFVMLVYISFYFVCSSVLDKKERIKLVFYLLLICSSIVAAADLGYHLKVGVSTIIERYPFWPGKQAISLFLVLSFLIIISVAALNWRNTRPVLKAGYILALTVQALCLALTYSRGAWFSLMASLLVLCLFKSRKLIYLILALFCLLVLFSPQAVRGRLGSAFRMEDENIKQRFAIWETTLVLIKDNPLTGVGPGNFGTVHLERYRKPGDKFSWWKENYHAHNLYLQIAGETGIVGLALFMFLIWRIVTGGYRLIRSEGDRFILGARLGAYSAFLGFLFWSMAECTYTGEFSPLSFFHLNLIIILYINIILYPPAQKAGER